jgi:hypothetical protein
MAIDPNDTEALLSEARLALHRLRTGTAVVEVDCGDYRTKFTPATVENLAAYISELEQRISGVPFRGAVGFWF